MPKKMNLDLASYTKVHPKWVIILYVKPKIIELVEENKENLCDLGLSKDFFRYTTKNTNHKESTDKLDLIKIKDFCSSKGTV